MVFKNRCVLMHWTMVALAMEGLRNHYLHIAGSVIRLQCVTSASGTVGSLMVPASCTKHSMKTAFQSNPRHVASARQAASHRGLVLIVL